MSRKQDLITKKNFKQESRRRRILAVIAAMSALIVLLTACQAGSADKAADASKPAAASTLQAEEKAAANPESNGDGITIVKNDITEKASFIPYKIGDTKMEVIAVKAPDGTVRTALNTCQVCWDSGRGYYKQEGDELVCQNCGNRFKISQIEKEKNGCNPVPVTEGNKTDNGDTITISGDELAKYKGFFES